MVNTTRFCAAPKFCVVEFVSLNVAMALEYDSSRLKSLFNISIHSKFPKSCNPLILTLDSSFIMTSSHHPPSGTQVREGQSYSFR